MSDTSAASKDRRAFGPRPTAITVTTVDGQAYETELWAYMDLLVEDTIRLAEIEQTLLSATTLKERIEPWRDLVAAICPHLDREVIARLSIHTLQEIHAVGIDPEAPPRGPRPAPGEAAAPGAESPSGASSALPPSATAGVTAT
ncbi:MAG TPA: hypothetical protein VML54_05805 [Candidatus Limnocylindrales bacterium]|nr:hypothetical protein [Candidatus Limnocylindrales bacterium]